jgi:hypothetical protein
MRRFTILALMGILITSGGCNGSTDASRDGLLFGWIDDDVWRGSARTYVERDTLYITSRRQNVQGADQWLIIKAAQTPVMTYEVVAAATSGSPSRYEEIVGGDVLVYTAVAIAGTIALRQSASDPELLSGTFDLTLQGSRGTSRFTRGEFEAEMRDAP